MASECCLLSDREKIAILDNSSHTKTGASCLNLNLNDSSKYLNKSSHEKTDNITNDSTRRLGKNSVIS